MISVLVPTYNHVCVPLVAEISRQLGVLGVEWEVIVVDDGSTDMSAISANNAIDGMANCRYVVESENRGISVTRNRLMSLARYDLLLFLDSDVFPMNDTFISNYLEAAKLAPVVCGGLRYRRGDGRASSELRFRYGIKVEERTAAQRSANPHANFMSLNFLMHRSVAEKVRFDETFDRYGYEDTLFGYALKESGIGVSHIDNDVYHDVTDTSEQYLSKVRCAVQSLCMHSNQLRMYSRLIHAYDMCERLHLTSVASVIFRHLRKRMEANLLGRHPFISVLRLYKMSYLCSVMKLYSSDE